MTDTTKTVLLTDLKPNAELLDLIGETVELKVTDPEGAASVYGRISILSFTDEGLSIVFDGSPTPLPFTKEALAEEGVTVSLTYFSWEL